MTAVAWPRPRPHPMTYISPTAATDLEACSLKVGFARDPDFSSLRRLGDSAAVGIAAHAVYERVARGEYDYPEGEDARTILGKIWDQEVASVQRRLNDAWNPAQVPEPGEWRNIARARRSILRSQEPRLIPGHERVITGLPSEPRSTKLRLAAATSPLPWIERRLRDANLGIEGTPDRVERQVDGVWILDLKSGWDQDEATDVQRRQLFIYVHLVSAALGERPTHVAIDSRKGRFPLQVSWPSVETDAQRLAQLRSDFNVALEAGAPKLEANPSAQNCRYCPFRLVCGPSQVTVSEEWRLPLVVTGNVRAVYEDQARTVIDLDILYPAWRSGVQARVIDVAWTTSPRMGDVLSIAGVGSTSDGRTLVGAWDTLNYTLVKSAKT
jgi:hypothetical protein